MYSDVSEFFILPRDVANQPEHLLNHGLVIRAKHAVHGGYDLVLRVEDLVNVVLLPVGEVSQDP